MHRYRSLQSYFPVVWTLLIFAADVSAEDPKVSQAIRPTDGPIVLFNGKDLSGLYTWLSDTKYEDPRHVFSVQDGMLHISGDGYGGISTKNEYRDYHLIVEFKWGERTLEPRKEKARDSGILLHCVGQDGSYNGNWLASIEYQIIEGGTGDYIVVSGKYDDGSSVPMSLTCETAKDRDGENVWKKGSPRTTFHRGRINWYGRDPDWKDVLSFRGKDDVEKPPGQWNRLEAICDGGHITNVVNGVVVNEGFDAFPSAGKILIQAEMAELFVRKWELWPLGKAPQEK